MTDLLNPREKRIIAGVLSDPPKDRGRDLSNTHDVLYVEVAFEAVLSIRRGRGASRQTVSSNRDGALLQQTICLLKLCEIVGGEVFGLGLEDGLRQ